MIDIKEKAKKWRENIDFGERPEPRPSIPYEDDGQEHLFPCKLVAETTNKLRKYNNQLDDYVYSVKGYEKALRASIEKGPGKINLTWIGKMVEKFCKRLNYWIAWARYLLLKGLSGMFKKYTKVLEPIEPLYSAINDIISMNISLDTIVSFATAVIKFFKMVAEIIYKPIGALVQFALDFETYVPPLISESQSIVGNVSEAVTYTRDLSNELTSAVNNIKNSNLDPEIIERLMEKYVDVGNINFNIEVLPIPSTLEELLNINVEKPKWEDYA